MVQQVQQVGSVSSSSWYQPDGGIDTAVTVTGKEVDDPFLRTAVVVSEARRCAGPIRSWQGQTRPLRQFKFWKNHTLSADSGSVARTSSLALAKERGELNV